MLLQNLLIVVLFAGALAYVVRLVWRMFTAPTETGCAKGCGGCSEAVQKRLKLAEVQIRANRR